MIRTRAKYDGTLDIEFIEDAGGEPTPFRTDRNQYQLRCEVCDEINYVDEEFLEAINEVIEQGFDNPFLCVDCQQEYDDLEYEA